MNIYDLFEDKAKKQRLDPKCWTGYHKAGTKVKGDTRVNNCVPNESTVNEFAPAGGGGSGDYFQALASAWYNGTFNTGSLQKGIKSKEDVERLLHRGVLCPDGVTRKFGIDYNSNFDGVEIYSDDYYEHGDHDATIDSRTGQKWGPYDHMEFSDDELDESLTEFAPPGGDEGGPDEDEILFRLAKQWWLGTESDMIRVERTLASMGWEIGEDEGSYDDGGVFVVRAGDENGKSYQSWPHEELVAEGVAEGADDPFGPEGRFVGDTGPAQITTTVAKHEFKPGDRVVYTPTGQHARIEDLNKDRTMARIHVASAMGGKYFNCKVSDLKAMGSLKEKSTSQAQFRTMAAAAHDPAFARKVGVKQSVAREFHGADRKQSYKSLPKKVDEGWKDVIAGGAMALGALGATGAHATPQDDAQQYTQLTNKYYTALVQRAKEDGRELDTRTLNFLKAKAQDAAASKLQQSTSKQHQSFPTQGSEVRRSADYKNFESQNEGIMDFMQPKQPRTTKDRLSLAAMRQIEKARFDKERQDPTYVRSVDLPKNPDHVRVVTDGRGDYVPPKEADYGADYQAMVRRVAAQEKRKQQQPKPKRENSNMPVAVDSTSPIHGTNEDNDGISTKNVGPTSQKLIRTARQAAPDSRSDLDAVFAYLDDVARRTQDNYQEVNNILKQLDPLNTELQKTERELDDVENVNQDQQQLLARLKTRLDKVSTDKTPAPVQQKQKDADERDAIGRQLDQEPKQVVVKQEPQQQKPQGPIDAVDTVARKKADQAERDIQTIHKRDARNVATNAIKQVKAEPMLANPTQAGNIDPKMVSKLLDPDTISEDIYESRLYKMKLAGYFD